MKITICSSCFGSSFVYGRKDWGFERRLRLGGLSRSRNGFLGSQVGIIDESVRLTSESDKIIVLEPRRVTQY